LVLVALIASFLLAVGGKADASSDNPSGDEAEFVAALNQARAAVGVGPLAVNSQLTALARQHAQTMADAGHIFHASPISAGVTAPWVKLGENVGTGPSVPPVMNAFINSPAHYNNIVDPAFTYVGVGVVWVGNQMFTTHRFMQVSGTPAPPAAAAPAPAPAAPPTESPAPVPTTPPVAAPPTTRPAPVVTPVTAPTFTPTPATPERVGALLIALRAAGL
jgi:hypothetical protein